MKQVAICVTVILCIALAACGGQDEETLVGTTWQWEAYQDMADVDNITVPDPENYTLTLTDDGTASIKADCNQVSWTYELDNGSLTFNTLGPSTLAMCAEDSLDTAYLERLGNTATYVLSDGKLTLNLKFDSGNMEFSPE